jgi:F0F1-type ATP synthase assembly protein I
MFRRMYWPLIGGFIAFVLVAVLLGWLMDTSRHGGPGRDGH